MLDYTHVLIATDLAPNSIEIGKKAKRLAERCGAKLSIIHVIEHSPMVYGSGEFAIPLDLDLEDTLEKQAKEDLAKQAEALAIEPDNQWVIVGSRKEEIVNLAEQTSVDLVTVGAHDKHGLALLLGSTADSILHALPCDVLAIKVTDE